MVLDIQECTDMRLHSERLLNLRDIKGSFSYQRGVLKLKFMAGSVIIGPSHCCCKSSVAAPLKLVSGSRMQRPSIGIIGPSKHNYKKGYVSCMKAVESYPPRCR